MAKSDAPVPSSSRGLNVHLRGHVLLFDKRPAPVYDTSAGARLLLTVFVMETLRLAIVSWLHPALPLLILVLLLLLCALLLVRFAVGVRLSQLGLYPWDDGIQSRSLILSSSWLSQTSFSHWCSPPGGGALWLNLLFYPRCGMRSFLIFSLASIRR